MTVMVWWRRLPPFLSSSRTCSGIHGAAGRDGCDGAARWRRDWKRNLIERQNPAWNDLAVGLGLEPAGGVTRGAADPGTRPG